MKKVLFVVDERMMGGVSTVLTDILKVIDISKYEIDIMVLSNHGDYFNDLDKSINIIFGTKFFKAVDYTLKDVLKSLNLSLIIRKLYLIFLLKTKLIRKKIVKERKKCLSKKYDVEIAFKDGITAIFTAYGKTPIKYHWLHNDYSAFDPTLKYHDLFKEAILKFNKIVAVSNDVLKEFLKLYQVNDSIIINNIIDYSKIINGSREKNIKYDSNKLNFITVGRFHHVKGFIRLIEVMHELDLNKKIDNVILRMIGDGDELPKVKEMIKEYHLEDKVLLLGASKNPYPYMVKSDLCIASSFHEAYSITILESLTLKVPILTTKVLSVSEMLKEKYGIIVENSNKGLYNGILDIIENPQTLKNIKDNLQDYSYNINDIKEKIENLLDVLE